MYITLYCNIQPKKGKEKKAIKKGKFYYNNPLLKLF